MIDFLITVCQLLILELVWKQKRNVTDLEVNIGLVTIFFNPLALIGPGI